jgi:hypothetical protein
MEAPRLEIPADITPKAFYEELLPRFFQENRAKAASLAPTATQVNAAVRAVVEGDGGGTWTIRFANGDMTVTPSAEGDAVATFIQSREDWQVAINQGLGRLMSKIGSAPSGPPAPGKPGLTPQKIDRLKLMKGVLKFELLEWEGRTLKLTVAIGTAVDGKDPTAVIAIKTSDFKDMTTGKVPPQQALMSGKVKLTGTGAPFAMQLGAVLMMP